MSGSDRTTASTADELRETAEITDDELHAAVYALLAMPETGSHLINLVAVIEVHELSALALAIRTVARSSYDSWHALQSC